MRSVNKTKLFIPSIAKELAKGKLIKLTYLDTPILSNKH